MRRGKTLSLELIASWKQSTVAFHSGSPSNGLVRLRYLSLQCRRLRTTNDRRGNGSNKSFARFSHLEVRVAI